MLTLEKFVTITIGTIKRQGVNMFQPTLLDFSTNKVRVLTGVPDRIPVDEIMRQWIFQLKVKIFAAAFRRDNEIGIIYDNGSDRVFFMLSPLDGYSSLRDCGPLI